MRRTTKEHAYLHRYNGIHGRPRNEDSCCPCETKLQTAAKLVFPGWPSTSSSYHSFQSFRCDGTEKSASYLHLKKFSTRRHGNANKYLYLTNKWQNRISGANIVFYRFSSLNSPLLILLHARIIKKKKSCSKQFSNSGFNLIEIKFNTNIIRLFEKKIHDYSQEISISNLGQRKI